jgi:serine/threonine protein kinase
MLGSLQDWVDDSSVAEEDRLIALAQSFNGLIHLYKNGFEGHGDLKPSNILYADLRDRFELDDRSTWPSVAHPWQVRIADLGWADAWIDLGFTNKALRQYLAPERLEGSFIPFKSDVFSMGIVVAELLQQHHPASNLKKAISSEGKWNRCVLTGDWDIEGINSHRIKRMIQKCLSFDHADRPTAEECLDEICVELRETYGQDILPTLKIWNDEYSNIAGHEHAGWAATKTIGLGAQEAKRSREELEKRISRIFVRDFETCENWLALAMPLINLLKCEAGSNAKITKLRDSAKIHLTKVLGKIDRVGMESVSRRGDWSEFVQPYERFSEAIQQAADISGITCESEFTNAKIFNHLLLSAFAYSKASLAHSENDVEAEEFFLFEAIRHAPEEAVPYFFRANWRRKRLIISSALKGAAKNPSSDALTTWIVDLEIACRQSPDWEEPRKLLQTLRNASV